MLLILIVSGEGDAIERVVDVSKIALQMIPRYLAWLWTEYKSQWFNGDNRPLSAKTIRRRTNTTDVRRFRRRRATVRRDRAIILAEGSDFETSTRIGAEAASAMPPLSPAPIVAEAVASRRFSATPSPQEVDRFATEDKGKFTIWNQDVRTSALNCATMCAFLLDMAVPDTAYQNTATLMEAAMGLVFIPEEVLKVGERTNKFAKAFNVREGFMRADVTLPEGLMTESAKAGASKGHVISRDESDTMLDEHYASRGWDVKMGTPTRARLADLGLAYVADALGL